MENKLKMLFEYQRFDGSEKLAKMIRKTESRYNRMLSDEDLEFVTAAGTTEIKKDEKKEDKETF